MLANLGRRLRERKDADLIPVLALFFLYLYSFGAESSVHGPGELFGNDSSQIWLSLFRGTEYPWNPQNHLLYHWLVETGYRAWSLFTEPDYFSAFRWLKFFTALSGVGFLLAFRWLLLELGLGMRVRAVILTLTGLSVTAWFHFGAFETNGLTMAWIALYLVAVLRLTRHSAPTTWDHVLFVGSLVLLGLTRVEGIRFVLVSAVLLVLPGMRALRRPLARDLILAGVLFFPTSAVLAADLLDRPVTSTRNLTIMFERWHRPSLDARMSKIENLTPPHLLAVGRHVSFYSILMPIGDPSDDPTVGLPAEARERGKGVDGGISGWLFLQPLRNLLAYPVSGLALLGLAALLSMTLFVGIPRMAHGDALLVVVAGQWLASWLLYTWFNPFEPFLWAVQFLPLTMAAVAVTAPKTSRWYWPALGLLAIAVGAHNWQWFYLMFR